jgi:hypothetical protein
LGRFTPIRDVQYEEHMSAGTGCPLAESPVHKEIVASEPSEMPLFEGWKLRECYRGLNR